MIYCRERRKGGIEPTVEKPFHSGNPDCRTGEKSAGEPTFSVILSELASRRISGKQRKPSKVVSGKTSGWQPICREKGNGLRR